jgi:hypothetical protein
MTVLLVKVLLIAAALACTHAYTCNENVKVRLQLQLQVDTTSGPSAGQRTPSSTVAHKPSNKPHEFWRIGRAP